MRIALIALLVLAGCSRDASLVVVQTQPATYPLGKDMTTTIGGVHGLVISLTCRVDQINDDYHYTYNIRSHQTGSKETCLFNWAVLDKVFGDGGTCLLELKPGSNVVYETTCKEYPTELRTGSLLMRVFVKANENDLSPKLVGTEPVWISAGTTAFGPIPPSLVDRKKKVQ